MKVNKEILGLSEKLQKQLRLYRLLSNKEEREDFRSNAYLVHCFVPTLAKRIAQTILGRKLIYTTFQTLLPGSYYYTLARAKFSDYVIKNIKKYKVQQIVFLGAGYDTRAIRFQNELQEFSIFEVDASTTQNHKLYCYNKNKISIPSNIHFVGVNFEKENFIQKLKEAGYIESKKTIFFIEGLSMYLNTSAFKQLLKDIQTSASYNSFIVFDYLYPDQLKPDSNNKKAQKLGKGGKKLQEHLLFDSTKAKLKTS